MRVLQRRSPGAFAEGLDAWLIRASAEPDAEAAALLVAELLIHIGNKVTDGKWSG
jgi:hypothetical protein